MRRRHVHRAALLRHVLAALALGFGHLGRGGGETSHRRVAEQDHQQQNASEFASESHFNLILQAQHDSTAVTPVTFR